MNYLSILVLCTLLDSTDVKPASSFVFPHQMLAREYCINDDCKEIKVWMSIANGTLHILKEKKTISILIAEKKNINGLHTFRFANNEGSLRIREGEEKAILVLNGDYIEIRLTHSTFNN
jgi:hypothetical protein